MTGLTKPEIMRIVLGYIGVQGGYLGDFTYRTLAEFYPYYCDLDVDTTSYAGTIKERFTAILEAQPPAAQARILRGLLKRFPPGSSPDRTPEKHDQIQRLAKGLEDIGSIEAGDLVFTSEVVERAIRDAELLLSQNGAASGVDRVHTALHGYLKEVCRSAGLDFGRDASLTDLFKVLRSGHPAFQVSGSRDNEITLVLRSLGGILDALNTLRNRASLAHPNALLERNDALLAINAAKTILNYLDGRISAYTAA